MEKEKAEKELKEIFRTTYEKTDKLIQKYRDRIEELEEELKEYQEYGDDEFEYEDDIDLVIDTFSYRLEKGNTLIQQRVDSFVEKLKKEFCSTSNV